MPHRITPAAAHRANGFFAVTWLRLAFVRPPSELAAAVQTLGRPTRRFGWQNCLGPCSRPGS